MVPSAGCHSGQWGWEETGGEGGCENHHCLSAPGGQRGVGSVTPWRKVEERLFAPAGCPGTGLTVPLFAECSSGCFSWYGQAGTCGPRVASDSFLALTAHVEPSDFSFQTSYCVVALMPCGACARLLYLTGLSEDLG